MITHDPAVLRARNTHYGKHASTSKLIASLVSEGLLPAYFFQRNTQCDKNINESSSNLIGFCVVMLYPRSMDDLSLLQLENTYAVVPLCGLPEIKNVSAASTLNGIGYQKVEIVHALDIIPHIYGLIPKDASTTSERISTNQAINGSDIIHHEARKIISKIFDQENYQDYWLSDECDAVDFWTHFAQMYGVDEYATTVMKEDFSSDILYQTYQYNHPKALPSFLSSPIEWEQSNIEGHPFIPMSKYPSSMHPLAPEQYSNDFERPKIRLVAIPRASMNIYGDFEDIIAPVVKNLLKGKTKGFEKQYSGYLMMLVHHMQVTNIQEKIPDAIVIPEGKQVDAYGLLSTRTIALPGLLDNATLKLTLGVRAGGRTRTLKPGHIHSALNFTRRVLPFLSYNHDILTIQPESAAAYYNHHDSNIAMHCSCIIRESIEYKADPDSNDIFIVAAALMEKIQRPDINDTLMIHVWKLDTEEKRAQFLDRHIELYLQAFIPVCRDNGLALDAHGQNTIARFDRSTGELKGFLFRDIDGVVAHPETLKHSCGADFTPHSLDCAWASTIEDVYRFLYFTSFDTYLTQLIHVMGMHHNGRGWQMVRTHLSKLLSPDHPLYAYFFEQKEISSFCYIRSMMKNTAAYNPKPNVLFCNQMDDE